ncbi:ProQ/FINO family [Shigella sonnei]|nr:ProQ/FINO family [Shigella sonnei]
MEKIKALFPHLRAEGGGFIPLKIGINNDISAFLAEQDRIRAEQRAAEVVVLPLVPAAGLPAGGTSATDLAVELNGITYQACRGDFVVRLDGSTCLQLWNKEGWVVRREGDPLEVAQWLPACHDAGMEVRVQINESAAP